MQNGRRNYRAQKKRRLIRRSFPGFETPIPGFGFLKSGIFLSVEQTLFFVGERDLCPAKGRHPGDIVDDMSTDVLTNNWALIAAVIPALIALILILRILVDNSAGGQLSATLKEHQKSRKAFDVARKVSQKTATRAEKLASKAGNVPPRTLQEAREAAEDAKSLEKIAHDRVLVTANHVRRVIVEEFPPVKHEMLRNKYLPGEDNAG